MTKQDEIVQEAFTALSRDCEDPDIVSGRLITPVIVTQVNSSYQYGISRIEINCIADYIRAPDVDLFKTKKFALVEITQ